MAFSTQRSRVADELFQGIRRGRYPGGSRLPSERQLAQEFEVSRPVVREALGMLTSLGLVEIQIGRGAFVTDKDLATQSQEVQRSLTDITLVREVLESGTLQLVRRHAPVAARKRAVREALARLEQGVEAGRETTQLDRALHRALVQAGGSASVLRLWDDYTAEIDRIVQISPTGHAMDDATLQRHRTLAEGVLGGNIDAAIEVCHDLHEDYRRFLRTLLG